MRSPEPTDDDHAESTRVVAKLCDGAVDLLVIEGPLA